MEVRKKRKILTGTVQSRTGNKSVKVVYSYKQPHDLYRKEMKRKTVLHAHDEENACCVGDRVKIMATRPLSRMKRWCVVQVEKRGK
jgi:small subunit ribosomal protein S17